MKKWTVGLIAAGFLIFNAPTVKGETVMIDEGKTVKMHYTLTVEGQVVDSSEGKDPLEYVHGNKMIIPGLENELTGMKVGDTKTVAVVAKDAYGEIDTNAIVEIPKERLPEGMEVQKGMVLEMSSPEGQKLPGMVMEVKEATIIVNFNHPLAGKDLSFDVSIVDVQ